MADDIISLSSDDECVSPPPKRIRPTVIRTDVLAQLNKLKEITAARCEGNDKKIIKNHVEESRLTIIIEGDEKSKEKDNNIVSLLDESLEESATEQKDINISSDCLIVPSDSEEDILEPLKEIAKLEVNEEQNGIEENGHEPDELKEEKQEKKTEEQAEIKNEENAKQTETDDILNRPSTSKASDAQKLLDEFLETCAKSIRSSKYESKVLPVFTKMKDNFNKCEGIHKEPSFNRMLQEYIAMAKISAPEAVVSFQRIYSYLLDNINGDSVIVEEDHLPKLKVLEKTCKKLIRKLKKLEEAEINFDDEEDSTYMQIDRYSQRLNQVYNKYCQLLQKSPHSGRLLYERMQFVSSKYNEINRAITKSYKHNKFPTYYDIEKCVRKCVAKNNLGLSETEMKAESEFCFTKMGNLLQMRRKKELYEVHCGFITLNEDPANADESLKAKLQDSLQEGDNKMRELVEKYVKMQENNTSVELSEDSDDSNYKNSDSETES